MSKSRGVTGMVRRRCGGCGRLALGLGGLDARGTPGYRSAETLILEHQMVEFHWRRAALAACIISEGALRRPLLHRRRLGNHTTNELLVLLQDRPGLVVFELAVQ